MVHMLLVEPTLALQKVLTAKKAFCTRGFIQIQLDSQTSPSADISYYLYLFTVYLRRRPLEGGHRYHCENRKLLLSPRL